MKIFLIVNARASSVTPRERVLIQRALSHGNEVTAAETSSRGHATRLAQGAAAEKFDAVVVMGGDGTLNEAANGLVGTSTALGIVPGGSTNVFARTIGIINDPIDGTAQLIKSIEANNRHRIGLGAANGRYFLFHVGMGFDAAVVERVERRAGIKRYAGHPFFAWTAFLTWGKYASGRTPRMTVSFDEHGRRRSIEAYFTVCMNSNPYSYVGTRPLNVAPGLVFEKGLVIFAVKSLGFFTGISIVASALLSGKRLRHHRQAEFGIDVQACDVEGHRPIPYQLDGDYLGDVDRLTLTYEPQVLDVLLPCS